MYKKALYCNVLTILFIDSRIHGEGTEQTKNQPPTNNIPKQKAKTQPTRFYNLS